MPGPVLVLTAHADDSEFFCGGTMAKFAAEGREVYEVIATDNGRGSFELDSSTLVTQSRDVEAREAARAIGQKDVFFLGYPDGFLGDTPLNILREQFMRFIRQIRPATVMTFDPWAPYEPHPDHRAVAMAAVEAYGFANMPLFHPEHREAGLAPHVPAELYLFAKSPTNVNRVEDIGPYVTTKVDALCAHRSQMRLMIQDLRQSMAATGDDPDAIPLLDPDNYRPAIEMFVRSWGERVGAGHGLEYAEEFRYERQGDLIRQIMG
ncbi:MAG: PIG-L family deacetylase [Deltaproteobacteria bacterium]|nr:PIG-L family deacetylase [Deltaproteobacteria bacterium]